MKIKKYAQLITAMIALTLVATAFNADAQRKRSAPDASQGASVTQTVGKGTKITIDYHRPGVKGRNVWTDKSESAVIGFLVPRNGDPRPWRAGANEATKITFSGDAKVEGKEVPAGTYSLFMIPTDGDWTIVINKRDRQWGSFTYKQDQDLIRADVTPQEAPHQEWLIYGFDDPHATTVTAYLHWEKKKIPFKIEVAE